jgi:hypothetical protein
MSHAATNWAIQQRGLKPTTKIVLWHLCDRFNPDYGCFPSQERLAQDCEISRSTLNTHLTLLERAGLIRRVQRVNPGTKRQMPTRYILGFEPGFSQDHVVPCPETGHGDNVQDDLPFVVRENAVEIRLAPVNDLDPCPETGRGAVSDFKPEPCPENGQSRVRNPDSNLVREPLSKPVKEEEGACAREGCHDGLFGALLSALGLDPEVPLPGWWQGRPPREHVRRWQTELGLSAEDILETAEASRHEHPEPPDGPKALDRVMQRAAQRKAEASSKARRKSRKAATPDSKPMADLPVFYADWVKSDKYLPPSAISNTMRNAMLTRGLVTAEQLRERGIR